MTLKPRILLQSLRRSRNLITSQNQITIYENERKLHLYENRIATFQRYCILIRYHILINSIIMHLFLLILLPKCNIIAITKSLCMQYAIPAHKGQLISKANLTKKPTKIFLYFCPSFKKPLKSG